MSRLLTYLSQTLSLRARLMALFGVVACLVMADRAHGIMVRHAELLDQVRENIRTLARSGAERQADLVSDLRALLVLAAEMPESSAAAGGACHVPYERTVAAIPWLMSMSVFSADGTPTCTSRDTVYSSSVADRPYFRDVLSTKDFVLSDFFMVRFDGTPGMMAVMPRIVGGEIDSVIAARIDVACFGAAFGKIAEASRSTVILTDSQGTIVSAYPNTRLSGRKITELGLPATAESAEQDFDVADPDGQQRLYASVALQSTRGRLYVGTLRDEVMAPVRHRMMVDVALLIAGLTLAAAALAFGFETLVGRPVRSIARTSARFGSGDLAARLDTTFASREFTALAHIFNGMADRLEHRDAELRAVNRRLSDLATLDGLTGLANRRQFDERLLQEWQAAIRMGTPVSLIIIDVDHFKAFNDAYGHPAGDGCLRRVSDVVANDVWPSDLAARIGGEEFAVLLPRADHHRALHVARMIRRDVEALAIQHGEGHSRGVVTVSIGVATSQPGADANTLMREADEALYVAKREGRNRVQSAQPLRKAS